MGKVINKGFDVRERKISAFLSATDMDALVTEDGWFSIMLKIENRWVGVLSISSEGKVDWPYTLVNQKLMRELVIDYMYGAETEDKDRAAVKKAMVILDRNHNWIAMKNRLRDTINKLSVDNQEDCEVLVSLARVLTEAKKDWL